MRSMRTGVLVVVAILVPVALGLTAFVISRTSIATQIAPVPGIVFQDQGRPTRSPSAAPSTKTPRPSASPAGVQATPTIGDDQGGRCSEPEHSNDPTCGSDSGSSGPGGGDSSHSGSGSGSGGSGDD